ncbi:MAG: hypothetical protein H0W18_08280 [Acidobacteria bacterium]|nr:hypothetical protein [Acidobacteriota bacterium]
MLETRPSNSRPNAGIVRVRTTGYKLEDIVVIEFVRTILVYKRGHVPVRRPYGAGSGASPEKR